MIKKAFTLIIILLLSLTFYAIIKRVEISDNSNRQNSQLPSLSFYVDTNNLNFGSYTKGFLKKKHADQEIQLKIKYRGNSSAHYDKKCFSINFKTKMCFGNENCQKKWKLNAEYIDKTLMRNKLSYDLFNLFSQTNIAPKIHYVTIDINDKYHGIYALTEKVSNRLLSFKKNDTNTVLFKEAPISYPPEEHDKRHLDFLEYLKWAEYYKKFSEKAMKKASNEVYFNQRYPNLNTSNKKYLIYELTEFIFNSSNDDFCNEDIFNKYFDINNLIDWHLLLLVSNNQDGLIKNFYLYKQSKDTPFKICPWDFDHSFGRDGDGELNQESFININQVKLLNRLVKTNAFGYREKLLQKFLILKNKNILTKKNINKMIDRNISLLSSEIEKNETRWPLEKINHFSTSSFSSEINLLKNWVSKRLKKVEKHIINMQKIED